MRLKNTLRRGVAAAVIAGIVVTSGLPVYAKTWDISEGSITVEADGEEDGKSYNKVTQGDKETVRDTDTVITGKSEKNTVTIKSGGGGQTSDVTLKDVSIKSDKDAALKVEGDGNVRLELDGKNELKSGANHAGVEKNNSDSKGTLTIKDDTGEKGSLTATGGAQGAGIGGGSGIGGNGSNITISGDKTYVEATGGGDAEAAGAGIGGGFSGRYGNVGKGSDITIEGGTVIATGGSVTSDSGGGAAGIGGGSGYAPRDDKAGNGEHIYIKGDANVTAKGGNGAAGIGGGNTNNKMGDAIDIVIEGNAKVTTEAGGDVSIGGKNGEISNDDLLSKDFTGILTRKDNTGKVMEDYSKDATPLPASEENGVVWVDADVSGWGGVRIAVPEGTPTDSVSACYLEEGALLIVDAGGSDCLLEGRVSDLRQNGIRQLCLRWNGGEQTLSTDALAAAGGEDASFRLTEVNGGLTMVLNGLTRNELLAK